METTSKETGSLLFTTRRGFFTGMIAGIALPLIFTLGSVVYAVGAGSPTECDNPTATIDGNQNTLSYTAPSGGVINGVCIKSGANMFGGNQHSGVLSNGTYENGCYTVSGVGTSTVTVQRTGTASSTCQGLSHIDVIDSPTAAPSASPVSTPAPTSSPAPSASPAPTDVPTPTTAPASTDVPTLDASPTPTSTPTPTPSSTPAPTSAPVTASTNTSSTPAPSNTPVLEGAVLGASTTADELPATGTEAIWPILAISSLISGTGLVKLGLKKKST